MQQENSKNKKIIKYDSQVTLKLQLSKGQKIRPETPFINDLQVRQIDQSESMQEA